MAVLCICEGKVISIQCKESDIIDDVFNKYFFKAGLDPNDTKFYYNAKEVKKCGKTLFALGIVNNSKIDVVSPKYFYFSNFNENNLDLYNKKLDKENELNYIINDLKNEIKDLKHNLNIKEKENEIIKKENLQLKNETNKLLLKILNINEETNNKIKNINLNNNNSDKKK